MTQDEIIEMAIENTINGLNFNQEGLVRFANLVAAKAPPQRTWVGLTANEIALINADYPLPQGFAKAIEAKLKEKNT